MNRIAFTLPDVGLREIKGLVYIDEGYLVLRLHNALLGEMDIEKDRVLIEPSALHDLYVKRGVFRDRLVLRPKSVELLELIPGQHLSTVELRVWRKHRDDLERLVDEYDALLMGP